MTDYSIHILNESGYPVSDHDLYLAAWHGLHIAGQDAPCALTVTITSVEHVKRLNREYAGLDEATDVLSFAAEGEPYAVEQGEPPYLGDVVVAFPVAEKQAAEHGVPVLIEVQTLAVHGVLHLLGFDHDEPDRQAEMWALQSAALDAVRAAGR